jgi:hypothetical protein
MRGGLGVRLFNEPFDGEEAGTDRRAGSDVAVLGRRAQRRHAHCPAAPQD